MALEPIKRSFGATVGEMVLLVVAGAALVLMPAALGILALEWQRAKHPLRPNLKPAANDPSS
ncbi:MAG: hypothetical protein HYY23_12350 [Verrucomicrobia bacterium]|nr:hypothetical protein [Verrucomicrobiota bacterium]